MKWYQQLYVGDNAKRKKDKIIEKIKKNKWQRDIYVIALSSNPENLLDIYPAKVLLQPYFQKQDIWILGIAKGYEEGIEGAGRIVASIYEAAKGFPIKEYFNNQMFE